MYSIDFNVIINWMLPAVLRKEAQVLWLNALLAPLKVLHNVFVSLVLSVRDEVKITGQVRVLEYHLNRLFYPTGGINITDGQTGDLVYIFLESENIPVYLPQFISGANADFIVHCPNSIENQEGEIRAFLNRYKLPSKSYELLFDIIVI